MATIPSAAAKFIGDEYDPNRMEQDPSEFDTEKAIDPRIYMLQKMNPPLDEAAMQKRKDSNMADPMTMLAAAMLSGRQRAPKPAKQYYSFDDVMDPNVVPLLKSNKYARQMTGAGESLPDVDARIGDMHNAETREANMDGTAIDSIGGRFAKKREMVNDEEMLNNISDNMGESKYNDPRVTGAGRDDLPPTVDQFRRMYKRDPATDTEVEFYYGNDKDGPDNEPDTEEDLRKGR